MCLSAAFSDADISHHLRIPEWPALFSSPYVVFCGEPEEFSECDAQRNACGFCSKTNCYRQLWAHSDSWKERDKSGVIRALHVGTENVHSGWMETGQTSKEKRQAEGKGYFSQSSPSAVLSLWCCTHQHPGSSCSMATEEGLCLSLHKKACLPFQPATQDLRDTEKPRADLVWSKGSFHNGFM